MSFNKNSSVPVATYCVPAHEVQTVPEFSYGAIDCVTSEVYYPSASAEYYTDPTDDPDFCDIIADLAQDENFDFSWGPSAVALPVENEHGPVSAISIAVPEGFVCPYDGKSIVIAANAVNAIEDEEFKQKCMSWSVEEPSEDPVIYKKKLLQDHKSRRLHAAQRLREKRQRTKNKQLAKSSDGGPLPGLPTLDRKIQPTTITARQAAAAHRERVKGKFKHNKTRWIAVTEFLRQTHLHDGDGASVGGGVDGGVSGHGGGSGSGGSGSAGGGAGGISLPLRS